MHMQSCKRGWQKYIVIDALDECEKRTKFLPALKLLSECVSLFITSRDEGDIRMSFGEYTSLRVSIEPSYIDGKIQEFIQEEIKDRLRTNSLREGPGLGRQDY